MFGKLVLVDQKIRIYCFGIALVVAFGEQDIHISVAEWYFYIQSSISPYLTRNICKSKLRKIVQTQRLIFLVKSQSGAADTQTFPNKLRTTTWTCEKTRKERKFSSMKKDQLWSFKTKFGPKKPQE